MVLTVGWELFILVVAVLMIIAVVMGKSFRDQIAGVLAVLVIALLICIITYLIHTNDERVRTNIQNTSPCAQLMLSYSVYYADLYRITSTPDGSCSFIRKGPNE